MSKKEDSITISAGTYWVGDPCFASCLDWDTELEESRQINGNVAEFPGFVASSTAYGDGVFQDQFGRVYPVEAGMIGVVPAEAGFLAPYGMHQITFDHPFAISYNHPVIHIGPLTINTDFLDECQDLCCSGEEDFCSDCAEEDE